MARAYNKYKGGVDGDIVDGGLMLKEIVNKLLPRGSGRRKLIGTIVQAIVVRNTGSHIESRVSKVISPKDSLYPVYEKDGDSQEYFLGGVRQIETVDALLYQYAGKRLPDCHSIADWACHYGRLLRCFRAALPTATLYACDIDQDAVKFCVSEFGCQPFPLKWNLEELTVSAQFDLIVCISLLTHTRKEYLSGVLEFWERALRPGGILLFTYLGEDYIEEWVAGRMKHYGQVSPTSIQRSVAEFRQYGHTFAGYKTHYGGLETTEYGIGFIRRDLIENEIKKHPTLELRLLLSGFENTFGQDLAVISKALR